MNQGLPQLGHSIEEIKRVSRILEMVQLVAVAPCRYRRRDFADRFELSERMIQKDITVIRHGLRLPLHRSREGYYFEEVPQLPAVYFSFAEGLALLQAVQVARQVSGVDSTELAAAIARLEALFPPEFKRLLRQTATRSPFTAEREHRQEMLRLLTVALVELCKVEVVYETSSRGGAISTRVVRPYHLMPYVRSWQLIAYCERRKDTLMFKVDRIHRATLLEDERYTVPDDFDLEAYMGTTWGLMRGEAGEPVDVVLHFGPRAGRWVAEEFWHASQQAEEQPAGSVLFRLHVAITPEFINWLLYYGDRVKVLEPMSLRERVAEEHRRAAEVNE